MIDMRDLKKQISSLEKDDILRLFGVEERRTMMDHLMPAIGVFSVGLLVGAGIGMLLAPKPGRELRSDLRSRIGSGRESANSTGLGSMSGMGETGSTRAM
jgi:YtxH-like protein